MNKYILLFLTAISVFFNTTFANPTQTNSTEGDKVFTYFYPLLVAYTTRDIITNTTVAQGTKAPINQLANIRNLVDASFKDVVSPNADTLYSAAFIDTTAEPMVLSMPAIKDRYFLVPFLDEWGDSVGSFGTRTGETDATTYVIVGANYNKALPQSLKDAKIVKLTSNFSFLVIRTQVFGKSDVKNVNDLQDKMKLVPLSAYGNKSYTPPKGVVNPNLPKENPNKVIFGMNAKQYYDSAFKYYNLNTLPKEDAEFTNFLATKGIVYGKTTSFDQLSPAVQKELTDSISNIQVTYANYLKASDYNLLTPVGLFPAKEMEVANGWIYFPLTLANYGTDYTLRAFVSLVGYGANLPKDAIYPINSVDSNGQPLVGEKKYTITIHHQGKDKVVNGFWSLTMYQNALFVNNPINRYNIGSFMNLKPNADGSITLYIQSTSPGKDKESNWLPSPKSGTFSLMARLYWLNESYLYGTTRLPAVIEVK